MAASRSPEETIQLGEAFAREYITAGSVIALRGELGAGKTHFVKGIARALGIDERELTSPTFALAHEFDCSPTGESGWKHRPTRLYHLDCYRFEKPEELLELGVEDYLYPRNAATIIEWPERIEKLLPENSIEVQITALSETERNIVIHPVAL
jgi:tRNA threonylcarbamoyladenosine biosynthesis protein TsaE